MGLPVFCDFFSIVVLYNVLFYKILTIGIVMGEGGT